jgi:succinoglycan biosynthesis protein ExoV
MATYYYDQFAHRGEGCNFGDDLNAWLLPNMFHTGLINSPTHCLIGIGTILNDRTAQAVSHYPTRIVFSSGAGYGHGRLEDYHQLLRGESWHFACVRGPLTARVLGLPAETAITDGGLLVADHYEAPPATERAGEVFIPHVKTHSSAGGVLARVCETLGLHYAPPNLPEATFVDAIRQSRLAICEAMHGAITADAMRTPWLPVNYMKHYEFKWRDWMASIDLPYRTYRLGPACWGKPSTAPERRWLRGRYRWAKERMLTHRLAKLLRRETPLLSDPGLNVELRARLRETALRVNESFDG